MRLAADSSAFVKCYVQEHGSQRMISKLHKATELGLSIPTIPEILSALNRRLQENSLSQQNYQELRARLISDVRDANILQLTAVVISKFVVLLEKNALRTLDALHLACAIE